MRAPLITLMLCLALPALATKRVSIIEIGNGAANGKRLDVTNVIVSGTPLTVTIAGGGFSLTNYTAAARALNGYVVGGDATGVVNPFNVSKGAGSFGASADFIYAGTNYVKVTTQTNVQSASAFTWFYCTCDYVATLNYDDFYLFSTNAGDFANSNLQQGGDGNSYRIVLEDYGTTYPTIVGLKSNTWYGRMLGYNISTGGNRSNYIAVVDSTGTNILGNYATQHTPNNGFEHMVFWGAGSHPAGQTAGKAYYGTVAILDTSDGADSPQWPLYPGVTNSFRVINATTGYADQLTNRAAQ